MSCKLSVLLCLPPDDVFFRHQAKLQHNLMYLAAIADSQPPQTAPLSQVLMLVLLVGLALVA